MTFQSDAAEFDPFLEEVRSTSKLSVEATSISIATTETTQSRDTDREPREATFPLEAKEAKEPGRPKKQRKPSGHSHH